MSLFAIQNRKAVFNDFFNPVRDYEFRYGLYDFIILSQDLENKNLAYLEFGVSKGYSLRFWSDKLKNPNTRLFGFDTFKGLPEAWGSYRIGDMRAGMQEIATDDERVYLVKGLFQETLPGWLKTAGLGQFDQRIIHLDADLYSSTLYVLTTIFPHLREGDVLIFDEFNVPLHEFKAYSDFCASYYAHFDLIGAVNNYFQTAFVYRGQRLPAV
ncbi:MAG: class I SAM-dependent methyltransferase [Thermaurantimonas sp.]